MRRSTERCWLIHDTSEPKCFKVAVRRPDTNRLVVRMENFEHKMRRHSARPSASSEGGTATPWHSVADVSFHRVQQIAFINAALSVSHSSVTSPSAHCHNPMVTCTEGDISCDHWRQHTGSVVSWECESTAKELHSSEVRSYGTAAARTLLDADEALLRHLTDIRHAVLDQLPQDDTADPRWQCQAQNIMRLSEGFCAFCERLEENCTSLSRWLCQEPMAGVRGIYLVGDARGVRDAYIKYFSCFTNVVVLGGFEFLSRKMSSVWKKNKELQRLVSDVQKSGSRASVCLHQLFHERIQKQISQYALVLTQLFDDEAEECQEVGSALKELVGLQHYVSQVLDEANSTKVLWQFTGQKLTVGGPERDLFRTPARRLQEDSKQVPISASLGRSAYDRVLLFDDLLLLLQIVTVKKSLPAGDLVPPQRARSWQELRRCIRVTSPEDDLILVAERAEHEVVWQWKLDQAIRQCLSGHRDFPLWGKETDNKKQSLVSRFAEYTFRNLGRFKNATYQGQWTCGRLHGKGTLSWEDGRNYTGDFKDHQEHGFGVFVIPCHGGEAHDCYKCHWKRGQMQGYGICEYGNNLTYRGFFLDNARHGFGVLEKSRGEKATFRYVGHWENNKKSGYGVLEDYDSGQRYIGMWQDNQRHGHGVVVTQSGLCYQGCFVNNKLTGVGTLLSDDDSAFEGEFTEELQLRGKVRLTEGDAVLTSRVIGVNDDFVVFIESGKMVLPNGYSIEGVFSSTFGDGLQTTGVLMTADSDRSAKDVQHLQLGIGTLTTETRWVGIYGPLEEYLRSGSADLSEEAFLGFHVESSRAMKKQLSGAPEGTGSEEYLVFSGDRRTSSDVPVKNSDFIQDLQQVTEVEQLEVYLKKAFQSSVHPLGKLVRFLTMAFQATYSGMGANKHLLRMAQEEVKGHATKIFHIVRAHLSESFVMAAEDKDTGCGLSCYALVLPLILPHFCPELFMLYMLNHERDNGLYWQGIVHLGLLSDTKLLEFLDVQKHLWPLTDLHLTASKHDGQSPAEADHPAQDTGGDREERGVGAEPRLQAAHGRPAAAACLRGVPGQVGDICDFGTGLCSGLLSLLTGLSGGLLSLLTGVCGCLLSFLIGLSSGLLSLVTGLSGGLLSLLSGLSGGLLSLVTGLCSGLLSLLTGLGGGLLSLVTGLSSGLLSLVTGLSSGLLSLVTGLCGCLLSFLIGLSSGLLSLVTGLSGGLLSLLSDLSSGLLSLLSGLSGGLLSLVTGLCGGLLSLVTGLSGGLLSLLTGVCGGLLSLLTWSYAVAYCPS
ncbi:AL2CL protein, partial [Polypterus senegalus]|nr:AL2CL protein [Polypterus senegalus]